TVNSDSIMCPLMTLIIAAGSSDKENDLTNGEYTRKDTAMSTTKPTETVPSPESDRQARLLAQYGCGPIQFTGSDNAFYERHLLFDNVVDPTVAGPRERFEAVARSVRDVLSQRWVRTESTYEGANPKRVYYLSMEYLIGRSLANNVVNLLLDPV